MFRRICNAVNFKKNPQKILRIFFYFLNLG